METIILIEIYEYEFSDMKMYLKMSPAKCGPICSGLDLLKQNHWYIRNRQSDGILPNYVPTMETTIGTLQHRIRSMCEI